MSEVVFAFAPGVPDAIWSNTSTVPVNGALVGIGAVHDLNILKSDLT